MEALSALPAACAGNPSTTGWFPPQRVNNADDWGFEQAANSRFVGDFVPWRWIDGTVMKKASMGIWQVIQVYQKFVIGYVAISQR